MATVGSHQQAAFTIPLNGTSPVDADEVRLNDNSMATSYNAHDADATIHYQSSTLALRPPAGTAGRLWFTTDERRWYYDTGSIWQDATVDGSAISTGTIATTVLPTVPVTRGGTGLIDLPTNGQLPIGNGSGYTLSQLIAGPNTVIANGAGTITISCLGAAAGTTSRTVTVVSATAGQTNFAVTYNVGYIDVFLNGVYLVPGTDFTATTGTAVVLTTGAALNDEVVFVSYTQLSLAAVVNGTGTANTLTKWTSGVDVGNSQITDDGTTVGLPRYTTLRSVAYSWPAAQGTAGTALINDGSGNLSWSTTDPATLAITPTVSVPYDVTSSALNKRLAMNSTVQGAIRFLTSNSSGIAVGSTFTIASLGAGTTLVADSMADPSFSLAPGQNPQHIVLQADGKILLGGYFTSISGTTRNYIARINADGTLDTGYNPNANTYVYVIALQSDGKAIIGGDFTTVGGTTRNYIARLNTDGTLDTGFNPNANGTVFAIAVQSDGKIVIAGSFTTVGGTTRNRIARLNTDGTLDSTYNPDAGVSGQITALALQADGKIIVGGAISTIAGTARNNIARLNTDGTIDTGYNPNADNYVYTIALQSDGKAVVGGTFNSIGGAVRTRLARLNTDGTADSSWTNVGLGNPPGYKGIAIQSDGKIVVAGFFSGTITNVTRNGVARFNADGTLDTVFNPAGGAGNTGECVAVQPDGQILVAGTFSFMGGASRSRLARLYGVGYDTIAAPYASVNSSQNTLSQYAVLKLEKIAAGQWLITESNVS